LQVIETTGPESATKPRWPGLDGLRGIAVMFVVVVHLWQPWYPAGWMGVSIFFALSGFLITTLLLREHDETGKIDMVAFWTRRARRLLPALLLVVVSAVALSALFNPDVLHISAMSGASALTYTSNWRTIANPHELSQIDPIGHLWSLSVEEQIYLVMPVMTAAALISRRIRWEVVGLVVAVIAAGILRWWGTFPAYFATPVQVIPIAGGAALAWYRRHKLAGTDAHTLIDRYTAKSIIYASAAYFVWAGYLSDQHGFASSVSWGIPAVAVMSVLMIAAIVDHPRGFANPALRWVGERSYGLYMWHYIIYKTFAEWNHFAILAVSLVIVELSYRYLETPIRRRTGFGANMRRPLTTLLSTSAVITFVLFGLGLATAAN